jgi:phosphatidylglycerophosphatase A
MRKVWLVIATFFGSGLSPLAPGTCGSLATMLLVYFIGPYWRAPLYIQLIVITLVFLVGIPASGEAEKYFNKKDPGACNIDEVAGQMVTLLLVPHQISLYIAGFFLFRFFDILKPFPIRRLEKIPGGLGIMLDDIMAALYALALLQLYIYFFINH